MMNRLPFLDVPRRLNTYPIVYPSEASLSWQISQRSGFCFALFYSSKYCRAGSSFWATSLPPSQLTLIVRGPFCFSLFQFLGQMVTGVVRGNLHYKEPEVCRADRPEHSGNFRGQLTFQYHNKNSTETLPFVRAEGFVSTPACIIDFIPKGKSWNC